ncbi:Ribonuclease HI [Georgenia satyanarayanai]|uniref:ribonuclease H n=1 Tax=Georgenia satyanarayanai TaxID=860221 RepID=A0A2Y9BWM7_9MICO|nr:ribonuclease H [Georgenia satyanarayanai]PYG01093.1 ribonuclease HI [Georgenia satyanarayanai]SSA39332.1 Ribonuclease HI [Georgenia satyanarayanai]
MAAWSTQTQLGKQLGLDARQVGTRLTELGLKSGSTATESAVSRGLAKKTAMRDGTEFYVWSTAEVLALLGGPRETATTVTPATTDHSAFDLVYATDGSAIRNPGPTGWAWVNQRTGETGAGGLSHGTNNIGELLALRYALEHAGPDGDLLVRADSKYVINIATTWGRGWQRRGWKKADGKVPENLEIVQTIIALIDARTGRTELEWVKGHAGDHFNEIVDQLANAEARAAG